MLQSNHKSEIFNAHRAAILLQAFNSLDETFVSLPREEQEAAFANISRKNDLKAAFKTAKFHFNLYLFKIAPKDSQKGRAFRAAAINYFQYHEILFSQAEKNAKLGELAKLLPLDNLEPKDKEMLHYLGFQKLSKTVSFAFQQKTELKIQAWRQQQGQKIIGTKTAASSLEL